MASVNWSRRILLAAAIITAWFALAPLSRAADAPAVLSRAETFVLSTSRQAIAILETAKLDQAGLKQLFRSRFDHELMGRYALGGYWPQADAAQRTEYQALFADYVPSNSVGQLRGYRGARIAIVGSRPVEDGDSMVMTSVAPKNGDAIVFGWRVRAYREDYRVVDIVFDGASYLTGLRQQFISIAARNGIDGLLELLRKQTAAQAATGVTG